MISPNDAIGKANSDGPDQTALRTNFMGKLEPIIHSNNISKEVKRQSGLCHLLMDKLSVKCKKHIPSPIKVTISDLAQMYWSYILHKSEWVGAFHVITYICSLTICSPN